MTSFVHLRLHTEYSLVDSVVRIPALVEQVAERGMPAVASGGSWAPRDLWSAAMSPAWIASMRRAGG